MNKERALIMAFWDEFKKKISTTSKIAVDKTKDLTEIAKLKLSIADLEKKIASSYEKIGRAYAEINADNTEKLLPEEFEAIADATAKIADCTNRLRELKGFVVCASCGKEIACDSNFCNACGAANEKKCEAKVEDEAPVTQKACHKCGAALEAGSEFCSECGGKIEK